MRVLALMLAALILAGCSAGGQQFPDANTAPASAVQKDPMDLSTEAPRETFELPEGYDPASEEGGEEDEADTGAYDDYGRKMYAGATPIPLAPIDMPTPTPKPSLKFEYGPVTAEKLRLQFEAPVGWAIDSSADDSVALLNTNELDGYNANLIIRVYGVSSSFKATDLRVDLRNILKDLGQYNFSKWKTTELAARKILNKDGFYADYQGTYTNGIAIYGRVMLALLDNNQVIMLHLSCPDGYFNSSYKAVINHVRDTLKQY